MQAPLEAPAPPCLRIRPPPHPTPQTGTLQALHEQEEMASLPRPLLAANFIAKGDSLKTCATSAVTAYPFHEVGCGCHCKLLDVALGGKTGLDWGIASWKEQACCRLHRSVPMRSLVSA